MIVAQFYTDPMALYLCIFAFINVEVKYIVISLENFFLLTLLLCTDESCNDERKSIIYNNKGYIKKILIFKIVGSMIGGDQRGQIIWDLGLKNLNEPMNTY